MVDDGAKEAQARTVTTGSADQSRAWEDRAIPEKSRKRTVLMQTGQKRQDSARTKTWGLEEHGLYVRQISLVGKPPKNWILKQGCDILLIQETKLSKQKPLSTNVKKYEMRAEK